MKLVPAMEVLQAKAKLGVRVHELEEQVAELRYQLQLAQDDRDLLAQVLAKEEGFLDWLIDQDVSSACMYVLTSKGRSFGVPFGQRKRAEVEGKSDLELALAYCNRPNAG